MKSCKYAPFKGAKCILSYGHPCKHLVAFEDANLHTFALKYKKGEEIENG